MAVFGLLLKYIFLVAIMVAVFIIGTIVYFMHRVRNIAQKFSSKSTDGFSPDNASNAQNKNKQDTWQANDETTSDDTFVDEELYDSRNPRQANRKIFSKDEGEYVDFEEEK